MHVSRPRDFSAIRNEVFGRWLEPLTVHRRAGKLRRSAKHLEHFGIIPFFIQMLGKAQASYR